MAVLRCPREGGVIREPEVVAEPDKCKRLRGGETMRSSLNPVS